MTGPHPLDRLSVAECKKAVEIIRKDNENKMIHFKLLQLEEPEKKYMTEYLQAEAEGKNMAPPPRVAYGIYMLVDEKKGEQIWIDVEKSEIIRKEGFKVQFQVPVDFEEVYPIASKVRDHPEVMKALEEFNLTPEQLKHVHAQFFLYGSDTRETTPRFACFLMQLRSPKANHPESNQYSGSLPLVPVFDLLTGEFLRIDYCASGSYEDDENGIDYKTWKQSLEGGKSIADNFGESEFLPELLDVEMRKDLKPYQVVQPEGPSFTTDGNLVKWQKWSFRVHFTPREGPVIQDVRYDGRLTFYRLSVSEMTIPYGDPRPPLHRRQAFDFGDVGGGASANSLSLGCDCLGVIKYFDASMVKPNGDIEERKNVICLHEQDDGLLLKHTLSTGRTARIARRRVLVVQSIFTVANYDYQVAWHFDQAANIELEVRATGIVSTQYIDPGKKSKWGTVVAPSIVANNHQHILSMRIDPAIDGHKNSVQVCELRQAPISKVNPYGVGFYNETKTLEKSCALDCDQTINRYLKIVNENKINPVSGNPVGYKIMAQPSCLLQARPGSCVEERAKFATHHFWVTKYQEGDLYAAGKWTNQSPYEEGGVQDMVDRNDSVRNDDVVVWHSFGLSHIVKNEDWPVMPMEKLVVGLHANCFFTENPALDVPPSDQKFNKSSEVKGECCKL